MSVKTHFYLFNKNVQTHKLLAIRKEGTFLTQLDNVMIIDLKKFRIIIRKFTIISQGPKLWNFLPDNIKSTKTTTSSFKINLKNTY